MLTHNDVLSRVQKQCRFRYIDAEAAQVLHLLATGMVGWVAVVGHPEHGSYEWIVQHEVDWHGQEPSPLVASDSGYGCSALAMRDGLNEALDETGIDRREPLDGIDGFTMTDQQYDEIHDELCK